MAKPIIGALLSLVLFPCLASAESYSLATRQGEILVLSTQNHCSAAIRGYPYGGFKTVPHQPSSSLCWKKLPKAKAFEVIDVSSLQVVRIPARAFTSGAQNEQNEGD